MDWIARLRAQCPEVEVRAGEMLSRHVSFRVGGPASAMAFPKSEAQLASLLRFARQEAAPAAILGAGTNVLPPDAGVEGLVICLLGGLDTLRLLEGDRIEAGAGVTMARVAAFAAKNGLTGLEFAHGIPGSLGGGLYMNAGAYGGELCQVAAETTVMDWDGALTTYRGEAQGFSYRRSAFQAMDAVIVRAVLQLQPGDAEAIQEKMQDLARRRRASQPLNLPSAGSTFKRPQGGYAAALIDQAGLKGFRVGGASVSEKHAGFVVNDQSGTAADILALIGCVQERVYQQSGIRLEPEIRIW